MHHFLPQPSSSWVGISTLIPDIGMSSITTYLVNPPRGGCSPPMEDEDAPQRLVCIQLSKGGALDDEERSPSREGYK